MYHNIFTVGYHHANSFARVYKLYDLMKSDQGDKWKCHDTQMVFLPFFEANKEVLKREAYGFTVMKANVR